MSNLTREFIATTEATLTAKQVKVWRAARLLNPGKVTRDNLVATTGLSATAVTRTMTQISHLVGHKDVTGGSYSMKGWAL